MKKNLFIKNHLKNIKVILFLVVILYSTAFAVYKGNVSGVVLDSESSEPVPNAVIHITDTDIYLTSNLEGRFTIENLTEGKYKLKVTHLAYQENYFEIDVSEKSDKNIKIFLIPKSIEISPVIVSDRFSRNKFEEMTETSNVLKGKELEREMGFTLAATLKNETGLAIRSMGPAPARPVIRGLGGDRVLISEDGNKTTDLSATSPDHAVTIETFTVNRVEVLRGPKVLLKTPITIGGVVNVIRDEIPEEMHEVIHGNAGLFGESANKGYLGAVTAIVPFNPFAVRLEISKRKSSDLQTPIGSLKNSYADNLNYSGGLSYIDDFGYAGISYRKYELDYGVPGGFIGAHPKGVDIEMFKNRFNFKSRININSELLKNVEMDFTRTYYRHKEFEASGSIGSEFRIINYLGHSNFNINKFGFMDEGTAGVSFEVRDFEIGGFVFTPPSKSINLAAYLFETFSAGNFSFEFSGRYSYDKITPDYEKPDSKIGNIRERTFNNISLSFSALYPISKIVYFGLNLSKSSRVPTIEELYSEGPHLAAYSYEVGNPTLKSESGYGAEFFVYHKFQDLFFHINFFYNYLENYIIPRNTGEINYQTFLPIYQTFGVPAALYGIEGQVEWKLLRQLSFGTTFSYTIGEFRDTKNPLPQIPPLKGRVELKYNTESLTVGINCEAAAAQKRVDEFEEPTAGYAVLNGFIQYSILTGEFVHNMSLSVDNIFDKEYRNHLSRVKSILPEAGRNFRLIYRFYF